MEKGSIQHYSGVDHETWSILMKRLNGSMARASREFLNGLDLLDLGDQRIPSFGEINRKLTPLTGWQYAPQRGNETIKEFLGALSRKNFLSSIDIRTREELDFCKLPDIFHDVFGHAALLTCKPFASFLERMGKLSLEYDTPEQLDYLAKFYWYTAEVGLIIEERELTYYGGSILSSAKEIDTVLDPGIQKLSFRTETVMHCEYDSYKVNEQYFVIRSFENLHEKLDELIELMKTQQLVA
jgi:phenylalanine-4-hydroxylase